MKHFYNYIPLGIILLGIVGCGYLASISPDIVIPEPPQPVSPPDTCTSYNPATSPQFIQGYVELDNAINAGGWILNVGSYTDTVFPGEEDLIDDKLSVLINAFRPAYETETFARADAKRLSVLTKGTDDKTKLNWYVWIRADGAKWYFSFSRRSFYHGGAVDFATFLALAQEYPTLTGFNLRDMGLDSLQENQALVAIVDTCKLCEGCRADFRFNNFPPSDSIVGAFDDAHWNTIESLAPGGEVRRGNQVIGKLKESGVVDCRGYKVTKEDILELLNNGYPVIANSL